MKIRKDMVFAVLTTFCLSALMFAVIPVRSGLPYDPWADITGLDGVPDDKIDMRDIGKVAASFGTLNTDNLTRNVNVTNFPSNQNVYVTNFPQNVRMLAQFYTETRTVGMNPGQSEDYWYNTEGYKQVTIEFRDIWSGTTPTYKIAVSFAIGGATGMPFAFSEFNLPPASTIYRTYQVIGSQININITNISANTYKDIDFAIYITA